MQILYIFDVNQQARGGPQNIPRPEDWRRGDTAPWRNSALTDLKQLENSLASRVPGHQQTGAPPPKRHSAVLIALYNESEPTVILTRRTQHMRSHSGEVSFPGGAQDPGESLWDTACREAHEEISLDRSLVQPIGELDHLTTVSSKARIVPYVARLSAAPVLTANPDEVDAILLVPLAELTEPGVYRQELWKWPNSDSWRPVHFFELYGDTVWGATANLLYQLLTSGIESTELEI